MQLGGSALVASLLAFLAAMQAPDVQDAAADRVGLPRYDQGFVVLRSFYAAQRQRVGIVYANAQAASVTELSRLPYPYGAIFVVEWRDAILDAASAPQRDAIGNFRTGEIVQIDVMRREPGFGTAYGAARTGEWEYVSYRPDGSHFVAPGQSASCAACHRQAGEARDFVFRGRVPSVEGMRMDQACHRGPSRERERR